LCAYSVPTSRRPIFIGFLFCFVSLAAVAV